jgi:predicted amidohydrolase
MRIGFIQNHPVFGKKRENIDKVLALIDKTEADLLVLPELFSSGYFFPSSEEAFKLAEAVPEGPTVRLFRSLVRKKKCAFVFGIAERKGNHCYNSAVYVTPTGETFLYRKLHLFYREKDWFSRGNLKLRVFPFYEFKIGLMICFDWIFPEVCRVLALKGANLVCHPSNLVLQYCQAAMRTRSIENRIFTVTANRVGKDTRGLESFKFTGLSQITGADGGIMASAGAAKPCAKSVDLDLTVANDKSPTPENHLFHDRRPDYYQDLG